MNINVYDICDCTSLKFALLLQKLFLQNTQCRQWESRVRSHAAARPLSVTSVKELNIALCQLCDICRIYAADALLSSLSVKTEKRDRDRRDKSDHDLSLIHI